MVAYLVAPLSVPLVAPFFAPLAPPLSPPLALTLSFTLSFILSLTLSHTLSFILRTGLLINDPSYHSRNPIFFPNLTYLPNAWFNCNLIVFFMNESNRFIRLQIKHPVFFIEHGVNITDTMPMPRYFSIGQNNVSIVPFSFFNSRRQLCNFFKNNIALLHFIFVHFNLLF